MTRLLALTRRPWVRRAFLALALAAAAWAIANRWDEVREAWSALPPLTVLAAFAAALAYVLATMASWRAVLADLGSAAPLGPAARMFLLSQLGKYLPGGVWNLVAAAELGADLRIPRRRSVTAMAVALLVSIATGLLLAVIAVVAGPSGVRSTYGVALLALPLLAALLAPPVLNRLLGLLLRRLGRPPLEHPVSAVGVARASAWALLAWLLAGLHVYLLVTALGADATLATAALVTGGYALAWTAGFLAVVVPAGVGVREAVLGLVLTGRLSGGAVVIAVLASRVLLTVADLALGLAAARRRR